MAAAPTAAATNSVAAGAAASGAQAAALLPQGVGGPPGPCPTRRQKSWDALDQAAMAQARLMKNTHLTQVQVGGLNSQGGGGGGFQL